MAKKKKRRHEIMDIEVVREPLDRDILLQRPSL